MKTSLRTIFRTLVVLLLLYWIALFVATHQSVNAPDLFDHFDKVIHFSAFAILSFLLTAVFIVGWGSQARIGIWVWTIVVSYGALDEYSQRFVPDRMPDKLDLLADAVGAGAGILGAYIALHLYRLVKNSWNIAITTTARCEA